MKIAVRPTLHAVEMLFVFTAARTGESRNVISVEVAVEHITAAKPIFWNLALAFAMRGFVPQKGTETASAGPGSANPVTPRIRHSKRIAHPIADT